MHRKIKMQTSSGEISLGLQNQPVYPSQLYSILNLGLALGQAVSDLTILSRVLINP